MNKQRFSAEEIQQANSANILTLAENFGYNLKKQGHTYKIVGQNLGGFFIDESGKRWFSHASQKGGGPIQFLMELAGMTWRESVEYLVGETHRNKVDRPVISHSDSGKKPEKMQLLPKLEFTKSNKNKWIACLKYLVDQRGIDREIVNEMMAKKKLYFGKPFLWEKKDNVNYVVFVGYDENEEAKYAFKKCISKYDVSGELKGSQKEYSFSVEGTGNRLYVFEAPIDLLSYLTIRKRNGMPMSDHCVSLAGLTGKALDRYLAIHPEVSEVIFALDNDLNGEKKVFDKEAGSMVAVPWNHGQEATMRLGRELKEKGYSVKKTVPAKGMKDWNDLLCSINSEEKEEEKEAEPE